jgi:hypothetical protein
LRQARLGSFNKYKEIKMKNKILNLALIAFASSVITSCGGSGSSSDSAEAAIGGFLDSAVAGLYYSTTPGGKSGRTDDFGQFNYMTGDTVEFKVGGTATGAVLGSGKAKSVMMPADIADGVDGTKTLKIASLLQSMDVDGDPDTDGIELGDFVIDSTMAATIADILSVNTKNFTINNVASFTGRVVGSITFVGTATAKTHLDNTRKNKDSVTAGSGKLVLHPNAGSPAATIYAKASVDSDMISTKTTKVGVQASLDDFTVDSTNSGSEAYTQLSATFVNRSDASDTFTILVRMAANYNGIMFNKLYVKCDATSQANCTGGSGIYLTNFIRNDNNQLIDASSGDDATPAKFTKGLVKDLSIGISGNDGSSSYTFTINGLTHDDADIGLSLDDSKVYDFSTISLRTSILSPANNNYAKSSFDNLKIYQGATLDVSDDFNDGIDNDVWDYIQTF